MLKSKMALRARGSVRPTLREAPILIAALSVSAFQLFGIGPPAVRYFGAGAGSLGGGNWASAGMAEKSPLMVIGFFCLASQ